MEPVIAVYEVAAGSAEIARIGRDICLEQTVELPDALLTDRDLANRMIGVVESVAHCPESLGRYLVTIAYPAQLVSNQLPQLLNLLYGNISMKADIRLVDLRLPDHLIGNFSGPRFGIDGIRRLLGVYGRPLLALALKPRGAKAEVLAATARAFVLGGGDIVKDDHNLVDDSFDAFQERVGCCHEAVMAASAETGRTALYAPNLMVPVDRLDRHISFLTRLGIRGALVAPLVLGFDTVRGLRDRYPLVLFGHPTFSGAYYQNNRQGIESGLLLGTLFRLAGVDGAIFPNHGGRFSLRREACLSVARCLSQPLYDLKPGLPLPAGGMRFDNLLAMASDYGSDVAYLMGGALLGYSEDLTVGTRAFMSEIRRRFDERLTAPDDSSVSSSPLGACEKERALAYAFRSGFAWEGKPPSPYKSDSGGTFRGVARTELIGKEGESTAFDLRYFQVEPDGFTSLERHVHVHAIVCLRGTGTLICENVPTVLKPFDVAYVGPLQSHQLRNEGSEPFGFFCIVDRDRDKPTPL